MILKNAKIVLEDKVITNAYLIIEGNKIKEIGQGEIETGIDLKGKIIMPGFIDCHVHGGYGVDFETGDKNRYEHFATNVCCEGITSYLQGSVTNSIEDNDRYFAEFKEFKDKKINGSKCLGVHVEGPFIALEKKGAHDPNLLKKPDIELTKRWNEISGNNIKLVTYASDLQGGEYTKYLLENNIIPSSGHSNMTSIQFEKEYKDGIRHVTHLWNGMSGADHREPGLAVGALVHKDVLCEVITDGIHLPSNIIKLTYIAKGSDNMCIITDAMNAKGMPDGEYKLGDLDVIKTGMKVALKDSGVLAGAGATYDHNVRTFQSICNLSLPELSKLTSINVAKQLNIFDKTGSIKTGKLADLVILNDNYEVKMTIVEGNVVYSNEQ